MSMSTFRPNPHHMSERPRRVRGGLRLASKQFPPALTGIAAEWMRFVSRHASEEDLKEGYEYARAGQTRSMTMEPARISALVQGRAIRAYHLALQVSAFDDGQWARVISAIGEHALVAGRLIAGQAPDELMALFESAGLSLVPRETSDVIAACNAPNEKPWCKHACCVAWLIAESLERDPLGMLTLRGLPPAELVERLRDKRASATAAGGAQTPNLTSELSGRMYEGSAPLETVLEEFWHVGTGFDELDVTIRPAEVSHALLRRLGPSPFTEGRFPLVGLLATCYDLISRDALKQSAGDEGGTPDESSDADEDLEHSS